MNPPLVFHNDSLKGRGLQVGYRIDGTCVDLMCLATSEIRRRNLMRGKNTKRYK